MLPLLLAGILFLFLLLGSLVFLFCLVLPPTRRYALSAALWCAICGPCTVGLMLLAGARLIATAFITQTANSQTLHAPRLLAAFGWTYLIAGILLTTVLATSAAAIHQALITRMTFALFRLYAAVVTTGIGSIFGWCLGWFMMSGHLEGYLRFIVWISCMLALIALFGTAAYKTARHLRGAPPKQFTWITEAEYAGP